MSNLPGHLQKVPEPKTPKHPLAKLKKQYGGLNAYARHKQLINNYQLYYPSDKEKLLAKNSASTSGSTSAYDVLKRSHKFLWDADDITEAERSWDAKLAKRYYDKLFKEYCIADLSQYQKNRVAMRWRIEREVKAGKGQFICGEKRCNVDQGLESWEVNFAYEEQGEKKNALVKLRLCPECSLKLNFHSQKKKAVKKAKKEKESRKRRKHEAKSKEKAKRKRNDSSSSDSSSDSEDEEPPEPTEPVPSSSTEDEAKLKAEAEKLAQEAASIWAKDPLDEEKRNRQFYCINMPSLLHQAFLEERSDLLKPAKPQTSKTGRCTSMCPQNELRFRSKNNLVHPLETLTPFAKLTREKRQFDLDKAVKEYSRPAADKKVNFNDVRPYDTLMSTSEYLLSIVDSYQSASQWPLVYEFVCDRFRAIRQDLIVQDLKPQRVVTLLETMIPFYLDSRRKCIDLKTNVIDPRLHEAEMDECFIRWLQAAKDGAEVSPEIIQAYAYYYLNNPSLIIDLLNVFGESESLLDLLRFSIQFYNGNSWLFFDTYKNTRIHYQRSALWIHFADMRIFTLQCFRASMSAPRISFPLELLAEHLGFTQSADLGSCLRELFKIDGSLVVPFAFHGLVHLNLTKPSHCWFAD
uniref:SAC3_GANP domain-containing protein n=1 Tax=Panagrellus redivivus TaxID=6233 RepID=A0A7E4WDT9_PANRE